MSGAVYALLALGFTLIYGVAEVLNMSHGTLYMLGAYMIFAFVRFFGFELIPSIILAVIFVGFVGAIIYGLIDSVIDETLAVLVVTLGSALVLQQLVILEFGGAHVSVPRLSRETDFFGVLAGRLSDFLGVTILPEQFVALVLSSILVAALWIFIAKTKIGGAMRAVAQDREVAMLMGINTKRLYTLTMAISASLAAMAGILLARPVVHPFIWQHPLVMSFAIVVLGGLGSIKGSVIGAFIIGYAETAVVFSIPGGEYLRGAVALAVMVLVLLLRPAGLFGKRVEIER